MAAEVVILLPGIMGSVLKDGSEVIWPGSISELVLPYGKMAQLQKVDLIASDVIRSVSVSKQYVVLIEALGRCGFEERRNPPTLYVCPYDWRKDNALSADVLASAIERAAADHGAGMQITLVAHSMGGLVSRHYLESGRYAGRDGFGQVKRLLSLATPHRGAPVALLAALGQVRRLFLNENQVKTIANNPDFPSLYQLLPPRDEPFAWSEKDDSRFDALNIYDPALAARMGLNALNLASADAFHRTLNLASRPPYVRYFFFAGTRQSTVSEARIRDMAQNQVRVRAEEREDAGDGTVPIWSSATSGIQMVPVGGEHGEIYKDGSLNNVLGVLLGKIGVLAAALPAVEIAVRDPVCNPNRDSRASISLSTAAPVFEGELRVVKVVDASGQTLPAPQTSSSERISYRGSGIDRLSVVVKAPAQPGLYRVQIFLPGAGAGPVAEDDLFVQA